MLAIRSAGAQDVTLSVSANRDQIYLGEGILLTVKVGGSERREPDLSGIQNCKVRSLGSQSDSRFSISIINGQVKREGFSGRIYTYELIPEAAGSFQAGPVRLSTDSRTLVEPGPTVRVTGVEAQTRVLVSVTASKESVLADDSFDVVLSVDIERMKGQYADVEPLDPADPPRITADYLQGAPPSGLEGTDAKALLEKRLVSRPDAPGFAVNSYTVRRDPFNGPFNFNMEDMFKEIPAKFALDRRTVEKNGASYFEYALKLTFTAREEGNYTFGPAVFKGKVAIGTDAARRMMGRQIFAVGPACSVRVVPPPEEGRPLSFVGAIGTNLQVKSALDAQTCNVGDPLTLTLTLSGNTTLDNVRPPLLGDQPALARDFKVYDDAVKVNRKPGAVEFSYTLRPTQAGTIEVPAIEVAYYDSAARAYRTVATEPIPLRANRGAELATEMLIETATNRQARGGPTMELTSLVVAPIEVDPAGAEPESLVNPALHGALAGAGPAVFLLVAGGGALVRLRRRHAEGRHRRRAAAEARRLIHASAQAARDVGAARGLISEAIRTYLAGRFDARSPALTPGDARRILEEQRIPAEQAARLCAILENSFNASYSSGAAQSDPRADGAAALEIIERIERLCRDRESDAKRGTP